MGTPRKKRPTKSKRKRPTKPTPKGPGARTRKPRNRKARRAKLPMDVQALARKVADDPTSQEQLVQWLREGKAPRIRAKLLARARNPRQTGNRAYAQSILTRAGVVWEAPEEAAARAADPGMLQALNSAVKDERARRDAARRAEGGAMIAAIHARKSTDQAGNGPGRGEDEGGKT
jgi:hypothetical protein